MKGVYKVKEIMLRMQKRREMQVRKMKSIIEIEEKLGSFLVALNNKMV